MVQKRIKEAESKAAKAIAEVKALKVLAKNPKQIFKIVKKK